jgi:hypothetical protein
LRRRGERLREPFSFLTLQPFNFITIIHQPKFAKLRAIRGSFLFFFPAFKSA